eukprot:g1136.t1
MDNNMEEEKVVVEGGGGGEEDFNDDDIAAFLATKKKKKKKKKKRKKDAGKTKDVEESKSDEVEAAETSENKGESPDSTSKVVDNEDETKKKSAAKGILEEQAKTCDYEYSDMLNYAFEVMRKRNPNFGKTKRYVMKPPLVARIGSKKTSWTNFTEICEILERDPQHLLSFYLAELSTEGTIDGSGRLTFKGIFRSPKIQQTLVKYIKLYVTCGNCKSPKTRLEKDQATRLYFLTCNECGASRSVSTVTKDKLVQQVKRGQRRKERMKA